ncbi:uncharacterized protein LOC131875959 [Cryptomeria japonica]|uniref:uncharacterized protein LOC131875959 n=1 Tax=Cryptomeria japonica TaxID=3369 RepID=UPI0027DA6901|nr:uncharacterized protein LOC131875959 [Cryptomeria japonica]
MKITSWNVRGLSAPDKKHLFKRVLNKLDSDLVILQETKLSGEKAMELMKYCFRWEGVFQDAQGTAGGLGLMWNPACVEVNPIASCNNWMACIIHHKTTNLNFPLFNIYGPIRTEEKLKAWTEITDQARLLDLDKTIMVGDFNAILDIDEKEGGLKKSTKVIDDFRDFLSNCKLIDIIPKNGQFTWTNRRLNFSKISERLDHFFVGDWWIRGEFFMETNIVPQIGSDHFPLSLSITQELTEKTRLEEEMETISNRVMVDGMTNFDNELEKKLKEQYGEILKREETYWKDKSRELWIADGDLNTKLFHASSKARRAKNKISAIKDEQGSLKTSEKEIEQAALDYFIGLWEKRTRMTMRISL